MLLAGTCKNCGNRLEKYSVSNEYGIFDSATCAFIYQQRKAEKQAREAALFASHSHIKTYQERVFDCVTATFGEEGAVDMSERVYRGTEEWLEFAQAMNLTREEAHTLVDYTFDRPKGDPIKEAGDAMFVFASICAAKGIDLTAVAEETLSRNWQNKDKIRAKWLTKPKSGPLPGKAPE